MRYQVDIEKWDADNRWKVSVKARSRLGDSSEFGCHQDTLSDCLEFLSDQILPNPGHYVGSTHGEVHVYLSSRAVTSPKSAVDGTWVYFVQCGDFVKIGVSSNVRKRIKSMQTANPTPLRLIVAVPGNDRTERLLHEALSTYRCSGEWFQGEPVRQFAHFLAKKEWEMAAQSVGAFLEIIDGDSYPVCLRFPGIEPVVTG